MNIHIIDKQNNKTAVITKNANNTKNLLALIRENGFFVDAPCAGNGTCKKCKVILDGEEKLACGILIDDNSNFTVELIAQENYVIQTDKNTDDNAYNNGQINVLRDNSQNGIGMAVDIGTTTVVAYFYDLNSGEKVYTASALNKQRIYGADVISRIEATCKQENGLSLLQTTIVLQLNDMIADAFSAIGEKPKTACIVGNTVMLHLLCGLDCEKLAQAPFTPTSLFGEWKKADEIKLDLAENAMVYIMDSVASYVGGDIVSGLLSCAAYTWEKPRLFIDIGTNGEMAIGNKDGFFCCATAAGPAFEGARIAHGVGGIRGAIDHVNLDEKTTDNHNICVTTISGADAVGICGSGLIDAVACLLKIGAVDETGAMEDEFLNEDGFFLLDEKNKIGICAKDIREIQLAKAAIAAGIDTLLKKSGYELNDLEQVIVAGGFGSYLSVNSACDIGLLPKAAISKSICVGNAAGAGAIEALLSHERLEKAKKIAESMTYYELSGDSYFNDCFIEQMMFE